MNIIINKPNDDSLKYSLIYAVYSVLIIYGCYFILDYLFQYINEFLSILVFASLISTIGLMYFYFSCENYTKVIEYSADIIKKNKDKDNKKLEKTVNRAIFIYRLIYFIVLSPLLFFFFH